MLEYGRYANYLFDVAEDPAALFSGPHDRRARVVGEGRVGL
jgi:hypothetical protein